ncbi:hypothetical protein DLM46_05430 [Paraburkholderia lacunae]|uniref:SMP-30/gluconolaconase/LRE-like region family protein n=1 Tax=Paraburkholderia lacunae TaxID=2211104 RepID=A0A370NEB4_9BURK|nr:hypothetical protein DLM46_05430 [Paraburkholderia lacunae]
MRVTHAASGAAIDTSVDAALDAPVVPMLAAAAEPDLAPALAHPPLSYRSSWIGNTYGYADRRWVQGDVQAIAVTPAGDVYTNAPWDEGGGEVGHYRDGQLLQYGSETHSWGRVGGDAVAVNDDYVFTAQVISSMGDEIAAQKNLPRAGELWYGVARRSRADLRKPAPFAGQTEWPGVALAFRLMWKSSDKEEYSIRGLAADAARLYVSNQRDNRVDIYDARSMQPAGHFAAEQPGKLALAPDGTLWVIERSRTDAARRVVHHALDGEPLGALNLPVGAVPVDLALDANGRVYVADNGPRQQVLIFSRATDAASSIADSAVAALKLAPAKPTEKSAAKSAAKSAEPTASKPAARIAPATQPAPAKPAVNQDVSMQLTATLGETGGIYAGRAGTPGPLRFNGLTGVGVDRAGNVYVAMNGSGPRSHRPDAVGNTAGVLLESYAPDGTRRFSLQSLLFIDGAQFVEGDPPSVYSGGKRFTLDLSRPLGEEWRYAGFTADRFRYPYDPFFNLNEAQRGTPMVRDIEGRRLLYTLDMTSSYLRIYRFAGDQETAIPSGLFALWHIPGPWPPNQPARGEWIWRDTAGKGRFAPHDFEQNTADMRDEGPKLRGWWVDRRGDIWQGTATEGIRCFPLQGFDRTGNPVYHYASLRTYDTPSRLNHLARLVYDDATDTLYLSGSTRQRPFNEANWNGAGSLLARYDHWKSGKPVLRYAIEWPDRGPENPLFMTGFAVGGDYLFAVESRSAVVSVYERDTGREVGHLAPGPEVGSTSGMMDEAMPISAHRLASGEYLVFVEEDLHGKTIMYRFTPPARPAAQTSLESH